MEIVEQGIEHNKIIEMKLHEYQQRIVDFLKTTDKAILSVDMGLGKTAAVLHYINDTRPSSLLIVAPKRVAETVWLQEAEKWGLSDVFNKMVIVSGTNTKRLNTLKDESKPYKIIGRDNLADVQGLVYELLILDELTSFKNPLSKRSEAINQLSVNKRVGLSGTFIANGAIDVYGQAAAVGLEVATTITTRSGFRLCKPFEAWRAINFFDVMKGSGQNFSKWKLRISLQDLIKPYRKNIFTLTAADYLTIPKVAYIEHKITLSKEEMNNYVQLETSLSVELDGEILTFDEAAKFMKLQTLANGFVYDTELNTAMRGSRSTKLEEVADFCEQAAAENEQVLLFYAFKEEALWLSEMLKVKGLRFCSVKDSNFMRKWNNGEIDVLIAHPASAGHGLNLQFGGRIIVWSSITYNFEFWAQANARLARQGQTKPVQIHVFSAKDTIETKQFSAIREKEAKNEEFKQLTK